MSITTRVTVTLALGVLLLTSSCSGPDAPRAGDESRPSQATAGELARHGGEFCPPRLPRAPRDTYGFGTDAPATSRPELQAPQEAWLCLYNAHDSAKGPGGAWFEWLLGRHHRLSAEELSAFTEAAKELVPRSANQACTADLGPRYLVSFVSGGDLTGVVVDGYGCRDVRLSDDPFVTVPGDAHQPGIVSGVLSGTPSLLRLVGVE